MGGQYVSKEQLSVQQAVLVCKRLGVSPAGLRRGNHRRQVKRMVMRQLGWSPRKWDNWRRIPENKAMLSGLANVR